MLMILSDRRPRRDLATARFSWKERTLVQQFRGAPRTEPMPPNAQDRLSLVFAPAFKVPGKGPLDFHVADGKGVAHYVFEIAGRERLRVPAGEFDALHLVKRDDDGRATEWWLDAGRAYLPLRVLVVRKDGDLFSDEENILVNYRVQGARYIVDTVFDKAILIAGVGSSQDRVTITRMGQ